MKNKNRILIYTMLAVALVVVSTVTFGQAPPPPPPPPPPPGVPFGTAAFLVAGLVGYGAKKHFDKKK